MEYANHLKEYAPAMSEAQVAEEVDRIRKAAVRNHTPEVYKLCYSAVDLTTLSCTDSVESVTEFAGKAVKFYQQFPHLPNVASICIYPPFVETVGVVVDGTDMRITSVAGGFPSSQTFLEVKVLEVAMAVENGADEIDIVLNVGKMLEGHYDEVANEVEVIRTETSPEVVLKVIIESGALKTPDLIRKASLLSMFAGADFVKTSTGKIDVSATPEAAVVMCQAIRDYYRKTGRKVGFKPAGGVRSAEDAALYYTIVEEILGKEWLTPELFRIGSFVGGQQSAYGYRRSGSQVFLIRMGDGLKKSGTLSAALFLGKGWGNYRIGTSIRSRLAFPSVWRVMSFCSQIPMPSRGASFSFSTVTSPSRTKT